MNRHAETIASAEDALLVEHVVKEFTAHRAHTRAVDDVSFRIARGTTFGLVGESGSGKSTIARCALHLIPPTSGRSLIDGVDPGTLRGGALRRLRARTGMVFQNPKAALNPRLRVRDSIAEPLRTHTALGRTEVQRRVAALLDEVGLAGTHGDRLPHQLSGGQAQRAGVARAIATEPDLVVLDEPTSALDVSVQAQVLNLLQRLKRERGLSYLLISHDLDVVRYMSDTAGVMRRGRLVEAGPAETVLAAPSHDYTRQLLAAMPTTPGVPPVLPAETSSGSTTPGGSERSLLL
ncbi:dipeptide ABC transporter ATP-binding protein [Microbacterium pseudoresistens]|uniref:ABC-type glutathione transport system ATPase component n=1 Tax=Microbacterium pseudoresistens TaxID=640634 RepID=A0A7Y9JLR5_9MICO|nr:ATP-binding cassette domain-containing protein [Microbacterium pseudoresistens]NYD53211.1 ABC-type glutathione transport system ATPase component [Microbacterium pseudoresistens]